jgi:hypothetical protein
VNDLEGGKHISHGLVVIEDDKDDFERLHVSEDENVLKLPSRFAAASRKGSDQSIHSESRYETN